MRRWIPLLVGALCIAQPAYAQGQDCPNRPVKMIINVAPSAVVNIVNRMNVEVAKALETPETRQRLDALLLERTQMSPEKFAGYIQAENRRYASLVPELRLDQKQ
jgi:tripartite-type tricarboxylate transporter receptor subunit TctC